MRCLSNDHGSWAKTRSASVSSSKTNNKMWSPASLIMNSFLALHNGLKVLPIASTLRARFVRNFAARTYSFLLRFFDFVRLSFVFSSAIRDIFPCTENFVHGLSKESSIERMERERKKFEMCFP